MCVKILRNNFFCKFILITLGTVLSASCATDQRAFREMDEAVSRGDFNRAVEVIVAGQRARRPMYPERNSVLLFLDKGMLEHFAGNHRVSSQDLLEAERLIREAYTRSITASFLTFIVNDNVREYPGEDFEDIYLNIFNAINFYRQGDLEGALVEIRKLSFPGGKLEMLARRHDYRDPVTGATLEELVEKEIGMRVTLPPRIPVEFYNSALARFLGALFYQSIGQHDSARIEFEQLYRAFITQRHIYPHPVPSAVEEARNVPPGKARLNVVTFSGLSPIKEEVTVTHFFPFFRNPVFYIANIRLPRMVRRQSTIDRIVVEVDGNRVDLELLEDMGAVIMETFNARYSSIVAKTYIRALLRFVAADIAAEEVRRRWGDGAAFLTALSARTAFEAAERADIRMARFLPDRAHVGGINLEPGIYDVVVTFYSGNRIVSQTVRRDVVVREGAINLIDAVSLN